MQPRSHEVVVSCLRGKKCSNHEGCSGSCVRWSKSPLAPGDEVDRHPHPDFDFRAVQDRRIELPLTNGLDCAAAKVGCARRADFNRPDLSLVVVAGLRTTVPPMFASLNCWGYIGLTSLIFHGARMFPPTLPRAGLQAGSGRRATEVDVRAAPLERPALGEPPVPVHVYSSEPSCGTRSR